MAPRMPQADRTRQSASARFVMEDAMLRAVVIAGAFVTFGFWAAILGLELSPPKTARCGTARRAGRRALRPSRSRKKEGSRVLPRARNKGVIAPADIAEPVF